MADLIGTSTSNFSAKTQTADGTLDISAGNGDGGPSGGNDIDLPPLAPDGPPRQNDIQFDDFPPDPVVPDAPAIGPFPDEDDDNPYQNSDEALPDDLEEAVIARDPSRAGTRFDED